MITAAESTDKWSKNTKAAGQDMVNGINRVTVAPGVLAAKQKAKMLARLTAAVNDGTWEKRVAAVTAQQWKDAMINKGVGRVSAGVDGAIEKRGKFDNWLISRVTASVAALEKMPSQTVDDGINRMVAHVRFMAAQRYPG
jgi:hypothetical protein